MDNIAATELKLTTDDLEELDMASALETEYPTWMFARQGRNRLPQ